MSGRVNYICVYNSLHFYVFPFSLFLPACVSEWSMCVCVCTKSSILGSDGNIHYQKWINL